MHDSFFLVCFILVAKGILGRVKGEGGLGVEQKEMMSGEMRARLFLFLNWPKR